MMRFWADGKLIGHLRDHSQRTVPQLRRLPQNVRERGIVVIARKDPLLSCDGRSDQITYGPSVLPLARRLLLGDIGEVFLMSESGRKAPGRVWFVVVPRSNASPPLTHVPDESRFAAN